MAKNRHLKTQLYTLDKEEKGYVVTPPKIRGLVLSGGGSKGVAYLGMVKAMTEKGFINQIEYVSGASAGAMTASIIAMGLRYDNVAKMTCNINIGQLLHKQGLFFRANSERVRNIFELAFMLQVKEHMQSVEKPKSGIAKENYTILKSKLAQYDFYMSCWGVKIQTFDDLVELAKSKKELQNVDDAFAAFPKVQKDEHNKKMESPRIAFADLTRLRSLLPVDKKHLIKNLSVVTTNQTLRKLELYSEELTPDESIAEKVIQSSAHPALFEPHINELGEYIADGGILDNMPSFPMKLAGLHNEEIACVRTESALQFGLLKQVAENPIPELLPKFHELLDNLAELVFGGRLFEKAAYQVNREKEFHNLGNMLYLDTGTITTTTTQPSEQQKAEAIESAYQRTKEFISTSNKIYNNPLLAMIYLGNERLKHTLTSIDDKDPLFKSAGLAKGIFLLQHALGEEIYGDDFQGVEDYVTQIEGLIKASEDLTNAQHDQILSLCLKQINFYTEGRFKNYIEQQVQKDEKRPDWLGRILELLLKPIKWILSLGELFKNASLCSEEQGGANHVEPVVAEPIPQPTLAKVDPLITPLRILSLFSNSIEEDLSANKHQVASGFESQVQYA
jgi:VPS inhibitor protein D